MQLHKLTKAECRELFIKKWKSYKNSPEYYESQQKLSLQFRKMVRDFWKPKMNVLVYSPLNSEHPWNDYLTQNESHSFVKLICTINFFYPVILSSRSMVFRYAENGPYNKKSIFKNFFVSHNNQNNKILLNRNSIDQILVPGLFIDEQGFRLGRGKGYYDRFLQFFPREKTVFIAASWQQVKSIPKDDFDIRIGKTLLENGLIVNGF